MICRPWNIVQVILAFCPFDGMQERSMEALHKYTKISSLSLSWILPHVRDYEHPDSKFLSASFEYQNTAQEIASP